VSEEGTRGGAEEGGDGATYASGKSVFQCEAGSIADEYSACFIGEL
jgi:hypothetical protein